MEQKLLFLSEGFLVPKFFLVQGVQILLDLRVPLPDSNCPVLAWHCLYSPVLVNVLFLDGYAFGISWDLAEGVLHDLAEHLVPLGLVILLHVFKVYLTSDDLFNLKVIALGGAVHHLYGIDLYVLVLLVQEYGLGVSICEFVGPYFVLQGLRIPLLLLLK